MAFNLCAPLVRGSECKSKARSRIVPTCLWGSIFADRGALDIGRKDIVENRITGKRPFSCTASIRYMSYSSDEKIWL
ncbi:predicted protein [Sclerotinia sclerotiorum 1980 UF-70]|uniref:Uncharacterized protein n=1 Tax=Sclerotinia sclerotiorum (strain ATCC 18683 / 1980 / Ss-1) TaxID=665079 RepID=A7EM81_SCLS1|nr:predicted protein [Sclerotinia sclerotiorum 1980 UF-70]EDO03947.1 predicted protein [Sclerotinia sclerotiorum 1980 UF-70]